MTCSKTFFLENCVHKQCSQCLCSCVETLVILWAKFHALWSLLSVLKIIILMLTKYLPLARSWKWFWPKNENTVNLKSGVFVLIILLNPHLTQFHSQKDPRLHFGKSFTLSSGMSPPHRTERESFIWSQLKAKLCLHWPLLTLLAPTSPSQPRNTGFYYQIEIDVRLCDRMTMELTTPIYTLMPLSPPLLTCTLVLHFSDWRCHLNFCILP